MSISKLAPIAARVLLGGIFLLFGANKLVPFLTMAPDLPPTALTYVTGLMASGYTFPLIGLIEVAAGALLLSGYFVPLALTLVAPLLVNIALFHFVLAPAPGLPIVLLAAELFLAWSYRDAFAGVLNATARPVSTAARTEADRRAALVS